MTMRAAPFVFAVVIVNLHGAHVHAQQIPRLFDIADADIAVDGDAILGANAIRARLVSADLTSLMSSRDESVVINFNLFRGTSVVAELVRVPKPSRETVAWTGSLVGTDRGSVSVVVREGSEQQNGEFVRVPVLVANVINADGQLFQIRKHPSGLYVIRQPDHTRLPQEGPSVDPPEAAPRRKKLAVAADSGNRFDVAVFYTPSARDGAGGTSQIRALIDLAVSETNTAYSNSSLSKTLRLVRKAEISYDESGTFNTILDRLAGKSDGHMDGVHGIRDSVKADLVCLIVEKDDYCGLAYRMNSDWLNNPAFEKYAFSVVHRDCATGYYSFAHELGHNMACCHDAANPCGKIAYPYAYGWHFNIGISGEEVRTIMAYAPGRRIQYFSNPDVSIGIYPTGKAGEADNVRTIENTAATVANFRQE